jgi:hypothetical protein
MGLCSSTLATLALSYSQDLLLTYPAIRRTARAGVDSAFGVAEKVAVVRTTLAVSRILRLPLLRHEANRRPGPRNNFGILAFRVGCASAISQAEPIQYATGRVGACLRCRSVLAEHTQPNRSQEVEDLRVFTFAVLARQAADLARWLHPCESDVGRGKTGQSTDAEYCRLHLEVSSTTKLSVSYGTT